MLLQRTGQSAVRETKADLFGRSKYGIAAVNTNHLLDLSLYSVNISTCTMIRSVSSLLVNQQYETLVNQQLKPLL